VLAGGYAHEHITHYTRESLAQLINNSGFEALDCKYVGHSEMIFKAKRVSEDGLSVTSKR